MYRLEITYPDRSRLTLNIPEHHINPVPWKKTVQWMVNELSKKGGGIAAKVLHTSPWTWRLEDSQFGPTDEWIATLIRQFLDRADVHHRDIDNAMMGSDE